MTYQTPCSSPENDPNDWFINREGKQYPDDFDSVEAPEDWEGTLTEYVSKLQADALKRRRHAKDKCFTHCIYRVDCLRRGIDEGHSHGTWGGYVEEELREIRKAIAARGK